MFQYWCFFWLFRCHFPLKIPCCRQEFTVTFGNSHQSYQEINRNRFPGRYICDQANQCPPSPKRRSYSQGLAEKEKHGAVAGLRQRSEVLTVDSLHLTLLSCRCNIYNTVCAFSQHSQHSSHPALLSMMQLLLSDVTPPPPLFFVSKFSDWSAVSKAAVAAKLPACLPPVFVLKSKPVLLVAAQPARWHSCLLMFCCLRSAAPTGDRPKQHITSMRFSSRSTRYVQSRCGWGGCVRSRRGCLAAAAMTWAGVDSAKTEATCWLSPTASKF